MGWAAGSMGGRSAGSSSAAMGWAAGSMGGRMGWVAGSMGGRSAGSRAAGSMGPSAGSSSAPSRSSSAPSRSSSAPPEPLEQAKTLELCPCGRSWWSFHCNIQGLRLISEPASTAMIHDLMRSWCAMGSQAEWIQGWSDFDDAMSGCCGSSVNWALFKIPSVIPFNWLVKRDYWIIILNKLCSIIIHNKSWSKYCVELCSIWISRGRCSDPHSCAAFIPSIDHMVAEITC